MAISRAQLLKELLPGLNALFGMEYAKYGEEHKEIFESESSDRSFEEETKLSGFSAAPVKNEALPSNMTMHRKHGRLVIRTKPLRWVSQLLRKQLKITCMTPCLLVIRKLLPALWLTRNRSKGRLSLMMPLIRPTVMV